MIHTNLSRMATLVCLSAAVALVGTMPAQATVLTFDINTDADTDPTTSPAPFASLQTTHAAYGDNVSSSPQFVGGFSYHYGSMWGFTPDITVAYSTGGTDHQRYYYDAGWPGADYLDSTAGGASRLFYWTFAPATGKGVRINSFELMNYPGTVGVPGFHNGSWTIYKDTIGGPVLDTGPFAVTPGNLYNNPFVVTTAQLDYMGTLVLEVNHLTGGGGAFALDDLAFNQEIPEPSSVMLMAVAGATLLWRRRS